VKQSHCRGQITFHTMLAALLYVIARQARRAGG
jgi:hypothetical protein